MKVHQTRIMLRPSVSSYFVLGHLTLQACLMCRCSFHFSRCQTRQASYRITALHPKFKKAPQSLLMQSFQAKSTTYLAAGIIACERASRLHEGQYLDEVFRRTVSRQRVIKVICGVKLPPFCGVGQRLIGLLDGLEFLLDGQLCGFIRCCCTSLVRMMLQG